MSMMHIANATQPDSFHAPERTTRARRGTASVFVLGMAMLILVLGLSALMVVRIRLRMASEASEAAAARIAAQSAVDFGMFKMGDNPDWRIDLGTGTWLSNEPIGNGTMSLDAVLSNAADADPYNDVLVFTGTGVCGTTRHLTEVTIVFDTGAGRVQPGSWKRVAAP
jgi:hypothetical protein